MTAFDQISPQFHQELCYKVLPTATEYLPLLRQGLVEVVGGYTTATLRSVSYTVERENALIAAIQTMMETGKLGPFLHFTHSWEVLATQAPATK
ncbi:MAG: hypothetical protein U9Q70_07310 [Chloroflexota bacterium]|nr:hypothetical protein [Chloroflexota bacterium]